MVGITALILSNLLDRPRLPRYLLTSQTLRRDPRHLFVGTMPRAALADSSSLRPTLLGTSY
jgi:hypothetical protein